MRPIFFHSHNRLIVFCLLLLDLSIVASSGFLATFARFHSFYISDDYLLAFLVAILLSSFLFHAFHLYDSWRGRKLSQQLQRITFAWATVLVILICMGFLTKRTLYFSRSWFVFWGITGWMGLCGLHAVLRFVQQILRKKGWDVKQVLVIGKGELSEKVMAKLDQEAGLGFKVADIFDSNAINSVHQFLTTHPIDEVWITLPLREIDKINLILYPLRHSTVTIRQILDLSSLSLLNSSLMELAGFPVLNIKASPMVGINRVIKAIEDRVLSTLILVFISPLMLILMLGIKLSSRGPVLFKQWRHGWDGKPIEIYKFRTMQIQQSNQEAVLQAKKEDDRITPFGKFLRRTSLDELPQFINVLQGRMSIVGPRPHALVHNEYYKELIESYMQRHRVKPGITGWAQINGWRGETDILEKMKKRVDYDLYYIEHWSLWFDLKIIFLTIFYGFVHKNAY